MGRHNRPDHSFGQGAIVAVQLETADTLIVVEIPENLGYGWCQTRKIGRFEAVLAVYP
ncbi:MAG: hypothetical protein P8P56_02440 [Yoonia sp.]|nr:hypothetical protein [Yoonia sp.]MDG1863617.1 hypothetical protein [Yoonia sp.]